MDPALIIPVVASSATLACGTCCLGYHFGPECMRCTCNNLGNVINEMTGVHAERRHRMQIERDQARLERERAQAHAQQVQALMRQAAIGAERVAQEQAARRELFRDPRNYTYIDARIGHPPVITVRRAQLAVPRARGMPRGGVIPDDVKSEIEDDVVDLIQQSGRRMHNNEIPPFVVSILPQYPGHPQFQITGIVVAKNNSIVLMSAEIEDEIRDIVRERIEIKGSFLTEDEVDDLSDELRGQLRFEGYSDERMKEIIDGANNYEGVHTGDEASSSSSSDDNDSNGRQSFRNFQPPPTRRRLR